VVGIVNATAVDAGRECGLAVVASEGGNLVLAGGEEGLSYDFADVTASLSVSVGWWLDDWGVQSILRRWRPC
jgi:hypothetical protein